MTTAKNRPNLSSEELARYKVVFALRRVGPEMQSDVLADGTVVARTGISVSNPIKLPEGIVLDRDTLFSAFQKAAAGEPQSEMRDIDGVKRDVEIIMDDRAAYLTYGTHRIAFPHAALLSTKPERRQRAMSAILKCCTLTAQARAQLQAIISKVDYSQADFFEARTILAGAPESFATSLREAADKGKLGKIDLLPSEIEHWENLTARRLTSELLVDFIQNELADERASRLAHPMDAIDVISLTFGGPELVPLEVMRQFGADELLAALRHLLQFKDPFAMAGAFDICADRAASDVRFVNVGDEILDRLVGDRQRLHGELTTFAAAFVIASAYLAEHQVLQRQPAFWRRLAAASHAALVTRVLGGNSNEEASLLSWATRISGKTFYLSVLNDADVEPRWRPDWISPNFVAADIYGRLLASLQRLGDNGPESWRRKLEEAKDSIMSDVPAMAPNFPALTQGWRMPSSDPPPADTPLGELFSEFGEQPGVGKFLQFMQLTYTFGFPVQMRESVLKAVQALRSELATILPDHAQAALDLAAFIAARNRDTELAEAVAVLAIERLVRSRDVDRLLPTISALVECAAAFTDRKDALETLARRLENLAFVAPAALLPDVLDAFRILQSINEDLSPLLGRAIATARVGMPRVAVAERQY
ncbi:hypothetical protein [Bradyrhizobium australiense]|uniref:Uncharacterized protein n=1 Tax=Bradyrhizobium australiense TaxID=2721161 RepID=A0A7Y4LWU9_9BRAD|nr:hypothetical protein [Bradyrhizobium australiense]NOJ41055.1 hypothetical protein [Bradyrhizobium australiense]